MNVRDLVKELSKLDPELDVVVYHEQHNPFEIQGVSARQVKRSRDKDGLALLTFEASEDHVAILEIIDT
jgi:hypothetical protein